ncbi:MAG: peptide chain release factor N(5)-glutamine methyltransferase, partial [Clostridia bacterium]|nr:peptide chain release factor N(5)-glutamine methyltransferase [Clostridia bacterium]
MVTLLCARRELAEQLRAARVDAPEREARELLAAAMGLSVQTLRLMPAEETVPEEAAKQLRELLSRRLRGEPLQYLLGEWDFFGRTFSVGPGVLIPRPETEAVVERALSFLQDHPGAAVLDLGCGSGCIGLTLALEADCRVTLADLSEQALARTRANAAALGADVEVVRRDLLQGPEEGERWALIVSNPPYLTAEEMACLQKELTYEPPMALDGGADGLLFYRALVEQWTAALAPGGMLLCEHGDRQGEAVAARFRAAGLRDVTTFFDLEGRPRGCCGRLQGSPQQRRNPLFCIEI